MPRLTVMMPARNAEKTIYEAVNSTLRALPNDSELVVWNDGSEDDTESVVHRIRDSRIRIISSAQSVGSGTARAMILAQTDSEFVANMDADDVSLPYRFRSTVPLLQKADLVFSSALRVKDRQIIPRPTLPMSLNPTEAATVLLWHNPFPHSTLIARRSILQSAGGYRSLRRGQDFDLWLRAVTSGARLCRSSIPTIKYRISSTQISGSDGYASHISKDRDIRQSYRNLLTVSATQFGVDIDSVTNWEALNILKSRLLENLRSPHRMYYSSLLSRGQSVAIGDVDS